MLCKYGCGEEITWIDGKPFSLQSHFKVCRPGGKAKPSKPEHYDEAMAVLVGNLGYKKRDAQNMVVAAIALNPRCALDPQTLIKAALEPRAKELTS